MSDGQKHSTWLGRLIERLRSNATRTPAIDWFKVPAKMDSDHRAVLNQAFITEDPRLVPEVAMLLVDPLFRQEACDALAVLLKRCDLKRFRWLDHVVRDYGGYQNPDWSDLKRHEVVAFRSEPRGWAGLVVLSWHPNGYVREAAVRALASYSQPEVHLALLLRMGDWVEPVALAAELSFEKLAAGAELSFVVEAAPVIAHFAKARPNLKTGAALGRLLGKFLAPEHREEVLSLLADSPAEYRVLGFELLLATTGWSALKAAINDKSPAVRNMAAASISRAEELGVPLELVQEAMQGSTTLRKAALGALARGWPEKAFPELQAAQWDPTLVTLAHFYLKRLGWLDLSFQREAILARDETRLVAAVMGLGLSGEPADAALIAPLLSAQSARVRRVALSSVLRLDSASHLESAMRMLADRNWKVRVTATKELRQLDLSDHTGLLKAMAVRPDYVRPEAIVRLFDRLAVWDYAVALLQVATAKPALQPVLEKEMGRWYVRASNTFARPTSSQFQQINQLLADVSADGRFDAIRRLALRYMQ